jgi:hypothetical protein
MKKRAGACVVKKLPGLKSLHTTTINIHEMKTGIIA